MSRRAVALVLVLSASVACKESRSARPDASKVAPPATASASSSTSSVVASSSASPPAIGSADAGPSACTTQDGPAKLARPGPFAVVSRLGFVDFYAQEGGRPVLAGSMRVDPRPGAVSASAPLVGPPATRGGKPPCAAAGTFVFCMNSEGEIRRFRTTGATAESDNFVARARPGTRIAAALANGHPVVAYLRDRTTSEGRTTEAYVETDDGAELRLSDDGAGATTVALAARGQGAVATYVDARRAMSPVHARTLTVSPKLALGKDAVLFIAGSAEPGMRVALGVGDAIAFSLLPVAHDLGFGLAIVKFAGEPSTDSLVSWSDYPNGIDPAPLAATTDSPTVFIARIRPSTPKFGSPHVLELGEIDTSGAFASLGLLPTTGEPRDVAIASAGAGGGAGGGDASFVLAFTDSSGAHAERLSCDKAR